MEWDGWDRWESRSLFVVRWSLVGREEEGEEEEG
jgi:hypothetical protein